MATKANRNITIIKLSVFLAMATKVYRKVTNQTISSQAMATKAYRKVTIIKPSVSQAMATKAN